MSNLKNIYKQAEKNNKTGNMTYKEFKKLMKDRGISNKDIKENLQARNYASQVFYTPKPQQVLLDPDMPETESYFQRDRAIPIAAYSPENLAEISGPNKPILVPIRGYDKAALLRMAAEMNKNVENQKENQKKEWEKEQEKQRSEKRGEIQTENPLMQQYWRTADYVTPVLKQDWGWEMMNPSNPYGRKPLIYEIAKFTKLQKGGSVKQSSQQDAVMKFVKALAQTLQADPQQVIQAAQQNPEALKSAVQVYQETQGDIQKAAQAFSQALQSKTQAAKHGTKLNYLKALKNQCAEDEELYYYKKGGKAGCGCRKKEDGGKVEDKKESTISKFKKVTKHQIGKTLPTAPQVIDAYAGGTYLPGKDRTWLDRILSGNKKVDTIIGPSNIQKEPRTIQQIITNNSDTIYRERPAYDPDAVRAVWREASSQDPNSEYNILKRRFNEAKTLTYDPNREFGFKIYQQVAPTTYKNGGSLNGVPFIKKVL